MSNFFSIAGGDFNDSGIFAKSIDSADYVSASAGLAVGSEPTDIPSIIADGRPIYGVSFNIKSRAQTPEGNLTCKLLSGDLELTTCSVPISCFTSEVGTDNIYSTTSQNWQTIKFDSIVPTTSGDDLTLRIYSDVDDMISLYGNLSGNTALTEKVVDYASSLPVTTLGEAGQGPFNPYNYKSWAWNFARGGSLSYPTNENFGFGTGDYTIETWVYMTNTMPITATLFEFRTGGSQQALFGIRSGILTFTTGTPIYNFSNAQNLSVSANKWTHIAFARSAGVLSAFIDGALAGILAGNANGTWGISRPLKMGTDIGNNNPFNGYLYNTRFTKGQALYTQNFTPPVTKLTLTSNGGATPSVTPVKENVTLLFDGESYLEERTGKPATRGDINQLSRSFLEDNDCSAFFPGEGYMRARVDEDPTTNANAFAFGLSSFTFEFWVKPSRGGGTEASARDENFIYDGRNAPSVAEAELARIAIFIEDWKIKFYVNGSRRIISNVVMNADTWYHVAIVRTAGDRTRMYINGEVQPSTYIDDSINYLGPIPGSVSLDQYHPVLFAQYDGYSNTGQFFHGWVRDFRIRKSAIYTSNFTPPTKPLIKNDGGTDLLFLDFKNAPIRDYTGKQKVYGMCGASVNNNTIVLPGTYVPGSAASGLRIISNNNSDFDLGTGDFTFELTFKYLLQTRDDGGAVLYAGMHDIVGSHDPGIQLFRNEGNSYLTNIRIIDTARTYIYHTGYTVPTVAETIHTICINRKSGVFTIYLDGNVYATVTDSRSISNTSNTVTFGYYSQGTWAGYVPCACEIFAARLTKKALYDGNPYDTAKSSFATTGLLEEDVFYIKSGTPWGAGTSSQLDAPVLYDSYTGDSATYDNIPDVIFQTSANHSPYSDNLKSLNLDGKNTYIEYPADSKYQIPNGTDFTLEAWTSFNKQNGKIFASVGGGLDLYVDGGKPKFGIHGSTTLLTSSAAAIANNTWNHIAVARQGTTLTMYVNGAQTAKLLNDNSDFAGNLLRIGTDYSGVYYDGLLSNIRLVKGQALYTTGFEVATDNLTYTSNGGATPSTAPLSSNVSLLIVDTQPASPFLANIQGSSKMHHPQSIEGNTIFDPTESYSSSLHTGSLHFDGVGDMITVNAGTTKNFELSTRDFTVEFWYYPTNIVGGSSPVSTWDVLNNVTNNRDGLLFTYLDENTPQLIIGNNNVASITLNSVYKTKNQWNHFAATKKGNIYRFFINGNLLASTSTPALNLQNGGTTLYLGTSCVGYISDIRIVKEQCLYEGPFTPPTQRLEKTSGGGTGPFTQALTATANLLIRGTDARLYDKSGTTNLYLSGSVFNVSYGEALDADLGLEETGLVFNGSTNTNFIELIPNPKLDLSENFWIEFWMKTNNRTQDTVNRKILVFGSTDNANALQVEVWGSKLRLYSNTVVLSSKGAYANGEWQHVGIGRKDNKIYLFKNGNLDTSVTNTTPFYMGALSGVYIGIYGNLTQGRYEGMLAGLRIIRNECLHTTNYPKPTSLPTLNSDGSTGTNNPENVGFLQGLKLSNTKLVVNKHIITSDASSLTYGPAITYNGTATTAGTQIVVDDRPSGFSTSLSSLSCDGVGYLTFTRNFDLINDFTIECWVSPSISNITDMRIIALGRASSSGVFLSYTSGIYKLYVSNSTGTNPVVNITTTTTSPTGVWRHIAATKRGNTYSLFMDGTLAALAVNSIVIEPITLDNVFRIGQRTDIGTTGSTYRGKIAMARIIDGRSIYNSAFTPPVTPLTATADTVFLYQDPYSKTYQYTTNINKLVVGDVVNSTGINLQNSVSCNDARYVFDQLEVQKGGALTFNPSVSGELFIKRSLKVAGTFTLSTNPGYSKTVVLRSAGISVLPGGNFNAAGSQKQQSATFTSNIGRSRIFQLTDSPNWKADDILVLTPNTTARSSTETVILSSIEGSTLRTTASSAFVHDVIQEIPSVINMSRDVVIGGQSSTKRGYMQFDTTSNSSLLNVEFKNFGTDTKKTESMVVNTKDGGSLLLSGCSFRGDGQANVNAISFYGTAKNIDLVENSFYQWGDSAMKLNNIIADTLITSNIVLSSRNHGIQVRNSKITDTAVMSGNKAIACQLYGSYLQNTVGNINGWTNYANNRGIYIGGVTPGTDIDPANANIELTVVGNVSAAVDSPFGDSYPNEACLYLGTRNSDYLTVGYSRVQWPPLKSLFFDDEFTFELFFKFESYVAGYSAYLFSLEGNVGGLRLEAGGQYVRLYRFDSSSTETVLINHDNATANTGPTFSKTNKWYHIALTRKNNTIAIFVDGERIATLANSDAFIGQFGGATLGPDANRQSYTATDYAQSNVKYYGFRVLDNCEYDPTDKYVVVPTAPFEVNSNTLILHKKVVNLETTNIGNMVNIYNDSDGLYIVGDNPNIRNTTIKNISSYNNKAGYGVYVSDRFDDWREPITIAANNLYLVNNNFGFYAKNITGVLSSIYMANSSMNADISLGNGSTKIMSVTGLKSNNLNTNFVIRTSKSYDPVNIQNIHLTKTSNFVGAYTATPLILENGDFTNLCIDNSYIASTTTGIALSGYYKGSMQLHNTLLSGAGERNTGISNLSCLQSNSVKSTGISFMNKNRVKDSHYTYTGIGAKETDSVFQGGDISEKLSPFSIIEKIKSGSKYAVVSAGGFKVSVKMSKSDNYNGNYPRLMIKRNTLMGFDTDTVLYSLSSNVAGYKTVTASATATNNGVLEFYVDCDGTQGSVYVDSWKIQ